MQGPLTKGTGARAENSEPSERTLQALGINGAGARIC